MKIYIDGRFVGHKDARISIFDHGFLYGDGVFEGIRAYNGRIFRLKEHLERLYQSAKAILLKIPVEPEKMERITIETVRKNKLRDAYIRLVVSRGKGDLGLDPRKCPKPSIICIAHKINLYPEKIYEKGISLVTLSTVRNTPQALNPQIKSLNYLNNILAKIEAINAGVEEGIMLNEKGYVAECTGENIFIITDASIKNEYIASDGEAVPINFRSVSNGNVMLTPPCYVGTLKGITRDVVLQLGSSMGLQAEERVFTRYDLYNASECFLTGTAAEIVPVVNIDNRKIGKGIPGKITKDLIKRFRKITREEGAEIYK